MKCLVKPEYWIDILLWKLRFFNSSYEARQQIYNGVILLNNKNILGNVYLKSGDIITFKNFFKLNIELNNKYFLNNQKIYSFVEIDYYTNTIIIIKDFFELELNDLCLLNTESYYLKKIKDFC
jgi:ribosomal protein S4